MKREMRKWYSRVSGTMSMDMRCGEVLLHLLRDHRAGALLEPGADFGERLDRLDDVGLAHALVVQHGLLATAACRSRRRELQAVRKRQHSGRDVARWVAPAD